MPPPQQPEVRGSGPPVGRGQAASSSARQEGAQPLPGLELSAFLLDSARRHRLCHASLAPPGASTRSRPPAAARARWATPLASLPLPLTPSRTSPRPLRTADPDFQERAEAGPTGAGRGADHGVAGSFRRPLSGSRRVGAGQAPLPGQAGAARRSWDAS